MKSASTTASTDIRALPPRICCSTPGRSRSRSVGPWPVPDPSPVLPALVPVSPGGVAATALRSAVTRRSVSAMVP